MRILHVITSLEMGGAEMLMTQLLPALRDAGYHVDLLTFNGRRTELRKKLDQSGIKVMDCGECASPYSLRNFIKLQRIARDYDVIHAHNTAAQFFTALLHKHKGQILVTTEHCLSNRRRNKKILRLLDQWMYCQFKTIVCISDPVKDALKEHLSSENYSLRVINNGINISKFSGINPSTSLKDDYDCSFLLMQVAGFRYEKDQPTAIRALKYLPEDVHLALVGDGPLREQCENLAKENGLIHRVHFLGVRSDVPNLLAAADVVLVSSHFEGFGLAAIEGMAAGKPVVVSDIPGVGDVVSPAALLFEHQNEKQLAQKVSLLYDSKDFYKEVARNCAAQAQKYDISEMTRAYAELYNQLNRL